MNPNQEIKFQDGRDFWFVHLDIDVMQCKELSFCAKGLYAILCTYMDIGSRSWSVKVKTLAETAGISERQARYALKELREHGIIAVEQIYRDGHQKASKYTLIGHRAECFKGKASMQNVQSGNEPDCTQCRPTPAGGADRLLEPILLEPNNNIPPIIPPTEPEAEKTQPQEEPPLKLSTEKPNERPKRASRKAADEYTPEFEEFWSVYPTYGRRKKAAFDAWKRLLRLKAATPAVLIHAARRYADMCRATCKEEQYTLHAASFLGPVKEAWKDYTGPEVQMGRTLKDVDKNQFRRPDGSIDYKAYERARRGLC